MNIIDSTSCFILQADGTASTRTVVTVAGATRHIWWVRNTGRSGAKVGELTTVCHKSIDSNQTTHRGHYWYSHIFKHGLGEEGRGCSGAGIDKRGRIVQARSRRDEGHDCSGASIETRGRIVQMRAWIEKGHDCSGAGMEKRGRNVQTRAWGDEGHDCSGAGMEKKGISVQARAWRK